MGYIFLALAIVGEVVATTFLKLTSGEKAVWWAYPIVGVGYIFAFTMLAQTRQHGNDAVDYSAEINREHGVPGIVAGPVDRCGGAYPSIVAEKMDVPEVRLHGVGGSTPCLAISHIQRKC